MALPSSFLEELNARTPLAALIGRRVRLARSGRQWKGCCPFHDESTPSFWVYEDGYHCFGCGAHGDAVSFLMQTQGASFIEAVEQLAAEAGVEVPKPSPEAAAAEKRRKDLGAVLEAAQASFHRRLFLPEGRQALDYLCNRGLAKETIRQFGLGWTGERGAQTGDLSREGIAQDQLVEAGLMRRDEQTGRIFEFFANRVMFPIRDRRGRIISFGGRIIGDGQPKYVNGPDTALFAKRRNLYALDLARQGIRNGGLLVVVEGYMDVIALAQAGFGAAVAPLGTALTQEQFQELWRLSSAPVLCFDGDAAGARAAARAAELALPMLAPERTLRLASLPAGEDPDTLIRRHGAAGFQSVVDSARPLAEALYELMGDPGVGAAPEQREAFKKRLMGAAGRISDRGLSSEYRKAFLDRYYASRRNRFGPPPPRLQPRPPLKLDAVAAERVRILTAILLRHPALIHCVDHAYSTVELPPPLNRLRKTLREWADRADVLDSAALIDHLTLSGLTVEVEQALGAVPFPLP
ncbi:MAG: DNA primase, partial [Acetobacteraceae bacterium]|nr:DNA primase [Acetobacteraceae bacterium]